MASAIWMYLLLGATAPVPSVLVLTTGQQLEVASFAVEETVVRIVALDGTPLVLKRSLYDPQATRAESDRRRRLAERRAAADAARVEDERRRQATVRAHNQAQRAATSHKGSLSTMGIEGIPEAPPPIAAGAHPDERRETEPTGAAVRPTPTPSPRPSAVVKRKLRPAELKELRRQIEESAPRPYGSTGGDGEAEPPPPQPPPPRRRTARARS